MGRVMRKTKQSIVVLILSFLAGCRIEDSVVGDDAVRATLVSVAAAHYFPTGDGKGDETYEVVLRNGTAAPVELSAAHTNSFFGIMPAKICRMS